MNNSYGKNIIKFYFAKFLQVIETNGCTETDIKTPSSETQDFSVIVSGYYKGKRFAVLFRTNQFRIANTTTCRPQISKWIGEIAQADAEDRLKKVV